MDSLDFNPPTRRSMSDEQVAAALNQPHNDEASLLAAMQLVEEQSRLREEDLLREANWKLEMMRLGSNESLAALDAFHAAQSGNSAVEAVTQSVEGISQGVEVISQSVDEPQFGLPEPVSPTPGNLEQPQAFSDAQGQPALSLFEQIARQKAALESSSSSGDQQVEDLLAQTAEQVYSEVPNEQEVTTNTPGVFPLVQIAPPPVLASIPVSADSQETPEANVFTKAPTDSAEQSATEFEEHSEFAVFSNSQSPQPDLPETGQELPSSELEAPVVADAFDVLVGIAPKASQEVLDEAKAAVSTAHGPTTNQGASALFFNWLPIGGSVLPVVLAVYVHWLGLAFTDSLAAIALATFAAFATTTAGAIAGKRAGLPTFVVSRATFGVFGARIPAIYFALLKLVSASVMVLLLVVASQGALRGWSVEGPTATRWDISGISVALWQVIIGVAVAVVAVTSFVKLRYIKFLNFLVGVVASVGVIGALAIQLSKQHLSLELSGVTSWPLTLGASAVVFAALGSVWSSSGADFASLLKKSTKGSMVVAWSALILFLVPVLISSATLLLLEHKKPNFALLGFASIVPAVAKPYAYGVFAAVLLLLAALELRSVRLAVRGVYSRFSGLWLRVTLAFVFVALSLAGWHFLSTNGLLSNLHDYALVLSAPIAAWLGIFAADSLVRRIAYHDISLTRSYGFYGNFNVANLLGWILASAVGLGMIASKLNEFGWVGFLARHSINPSFWYQSNLGLAAAFAVGVLFPLCFGIPRIKRQEAEVLAIESRRYELRDVLVTSEVEQVSVASDPEESAI